MTTLLQLRDRAKQESDNVGQSFLTDAEWNTNINASYQEVYGLFVQAYGSDYFVKDPAYTFVTDGVNQKFALPSDFFKLLGVAVQVSSPQQFVPLRPYAVADRFRASMFNTIIPAAGQTVQLEYVPTLTLLAQDADVMDVNISANGGEEYIVADAAIKALRKEESDTSPFASAKEALKLRLEAETENRDAANPSRIVDVVGRRARAMQYRLWGAKIQLIGGVTPGWAYDVGDWNGLDDYGSEFY